MVRIGGSTPEGAHIKERDYYTKNGEFRVDRDGSSTMLNCLMYKLCYYRFGGVYTEHASSRPSPTAFTIERLSMIGWVSRASQLVTTE